MIACMYCLDRGHIRSLFMALLWGIVQLESRPICYSLLGIARLESRPICYSLLGIARLESRPTS